MLRSAVLVALVVSFTVAVPAHAGSMSGKLTVLSTGSGPKQQLRLKLSPGQVATMKVVVNMDMKVMGIKQSIPPMIQTMKVRVLQIMRNADIKIRFRLVSARLGNTAGFPPAVVGAMRQALAGMRGYTGTAIMDTRGQVRHIQSKIPAGVTPQMRQSLQSMEKAMRNISPPLPVRAVGKGARWTYTVTMKQSGIKLQQVATYRLRSIRGDRISLGLTLHQTAPQQTISQAGMSVKLISMQGTGHGNVTMSLNKLVPRSRSSYRSTLTMEAGGRRMSLETGMRMNISP